MYSFFEPIPKNKIKKKLKSDKSKKGSDREKYQTNHNNILCEGCPTIKQLSFGGEDFEVHGYIPLFFLGVGGC